MSASRLRLGRGLYRLEPRVGGGPTHRGRGESHAPGVEPHGRGFGSHWGGEEIRQLQKRGSVLAFLRMVQRSIASRGWWWWRVNWPGYEASWLPKQPFEFCLGGIWGEILLMLLHSHVVTRS